MFLFQIMSPVRKSSQNSAKLSDSELLSFLIHETKDATEPIMAKSVFIKCKKLETIEKTWQCYLSRYVD